MPNSQSARAAGMSVVVVNDAATLRQYAAAWQDLADHAIEANVFHEPWMLLPAFESFGTGQDVRFVLVFGPNREHVNDAPLLHGLFPLQRQRKYKGLPVAVLRLWRHNYCFLYTPLLRAGCAREALSALLEWARSDSRGAGLLEFVDVSADGPFHRVLVDHFRDTKGASYICEAHVRALFRLREDAECYVRAAMSGDNRRNLKRKERRLGELGRVEYGELDADGDIQRWIADFLRLEASGWKGRKGTAMASDPVHEAYFRQIAEDGFRRGRLHFTELTLDGRAIAHRCSFRAGSGAFFFKPGFDEQYAKYSPGLLLEVETVRRLHAHPEIRWMDSCTSPDNTLLNDLWLDRRAIHTILMGTGRAAGDSVVSAMPLLRWFKRTLRRAKHRALG